MRTLIRLARFSGVLVALVAATSALADRQAAPADVARFVAGMEPSAGSPLEALTRERSWQVHANHFNSAWKALEQRQLDPIAAWQSQYLPEHNDLMLYLFSGPDYLYANAFFPHASTYILTGLEPVGDIPSVTDLSAGSRAQSLQALRSSMQTIVNISFFITKKMREQLRTGSLTGTLPVIYVFLARAGKTVKDIELVTLKNDGTIVPAGGRRERADAPGAKITFSGTDGRLKTLYYFRTDLSNVGLKYSGLIKFTESFGPADSLVKSASYLMHSGNFKSAREFLFAKSARILQDDSGIPLRYFDKELWDFKPFGYYLGPIALFSEYYQRNMQRLFSREKTTPIDFGFGYKWRRNQSNVLLATRTVMPKTEAETEADEKAMEKSEDETMSETQREAEASSDEATDQPEAEAVAEQEAEAPADDGTPKPTTASLDDSAQKAEADSEDQPAENSTETGTVNVAGIALCRSDCTATYEPCRVTADERMEACFEEEAAGDCMSVWEVEASQCISERLACTSKCN